MGPDGAGVGRCGDLDERFEGDLTDVAGYGNGVCSLGGCVYDARYTRSVVQCQHACRMSVDTTPVTSPSLAVATYFGCTRSPVHSLSCPKLEKKVLLPPGAT